ncbi:protein FAR1-RELATED SEQUENCE 5-like [Spinacia oleracea]|uniref:Protein FAR1-RELATED SEQUENCE 5-like n=1 Tax=Spinacia oleracea TaxID=3562 RepID=A0ABM3RHH5_SPIOL|nr:protein FAR1-RELATED SEQUENCE 5-like [Spinacia oleracea]
MAETNGVNSNSQEVPLLDFGSDGINYNPKFVTSEIFSSDDAAVEWARNIAISNGFKLVKSSWKRGELYLRCNRGERNRGKGRNLETAEQPNTKTQACGCKFLIKVAPCKDGEGWNIVLGPEQHSIHNHELITYRECNRQMSSLSLGAKQLVRDMSSAQARPNVILAAIQEQFPEENPNRRHIYNFRDRMRRNDAEGRDSISQFLHLAKESDYLHYIREEAHVVTHAFMAHPTSVKLLRTYPWVIGMDSTYKTNIYKMPFLEICGVTPCNKNFLIAYAFMKDETAESYGWVLDKLRLLLGNEVHPTAIVTDRELGLMRPIREIFPRSKHLLCSWHINKDVEAAVGNICGNKIMGERFKNGKWKRIMEAPTSVEYDLAVLNMQDSWREGN